jgi:hypothetical protein
MSHILEDALPHGNRDISREEWQMRLRWAYSIGYRDGAYNALKTVEDSRAEAAHLEEEHFRALMRFLEEGKG